MMKGISITALGALTSVGVNVPQTMGSLLTKLQWFDDLDLLAISGEPISGSPVRLRGADTPLDRYVGMAGIALAECATGSPAPLFLATSRQRDLPCTAAELLAGIVRQRSDVLDHRRSQIFPDGKLGSMRALAAAVALLRSGQDTACYVGGVDSLLDPVRLHEMLDQGRLLDGSGSDGVIPGEGAVFLRLERRSTVSSMATMLGFAIVDKPTQPSISGASLERAAVEALEQAGISPSSLENVVHDGGGDQSASEEIAMAMTRLPARRRSSERPWAPALSVGETGAVAAWLGIAMAAFFLREGVFDGPVLSWLTSEGTSRAAVVLDSSVSKEVARG